MNKIMKIGAVIVSVVMLASCGEEWTCEVRGEAMFSISSSGEIGGAGKGCSCEEIREFTLKIFGEIDETAMEKDFSC